MRARVVGLLGEEADRLEHVTVAIHLTCRLTTVAWVDLGRPAPSPSSSVTLRIPSSCCRDSASVIFPA